MGRFLCSSTQHNLMIVYTSSGQCSGFSSRPPLLMKLITSLTGCSTWRRGKEVKCAAGAYAQIVTNAPIIQYKLYSLHFYDIYSSVHFNSQFVYYSITELYTAACMAFNRIATQYTADIMSTVSTI